MRILVDVSHTVALLVWAALAVLLRCRTEKMKRGEGGYVVGDEAYCCGHPPIRVTSPLKLPIRTNKDASTPLSRSAHLFAERR